MTIQECYELLNWNYKDVKKRLPSDKIIERIIRKFPSDDAILILREGITSNDHELSFRGAHTLKGVAANLGFNALEKAASALTEQLRNSNENADKNLYEEVEKNYKIVVDAINKL